MTLLCTKRKNETDLALEWNSLLLSGNTESLTTSTSGLGSLTSDSKAPVMSKTSVLLGLSQSLKILSVCSIHLIGDQLRVLTVSWVFLSVQEPFWDVVFSWSSQNVIDSLDFVFGHFSTSLIDVDLSDLKAKNSKSSTNTSDLSKTKWCLLFTVDVCVLHSENMSEFVWI